MIKNKTTDEMKMLRSLMIVLFGNLEFGKVAGGGMVLGAMELVEKEILFKAPVNNAV